MLNGNAEHVGMLHKGGLWSLSEGFKDVGWLDEEERVVVQQGICFEVLEEGVRCCYALHNYAEQIAMMEQMTTRMHNFGVFESSLYSRLSMLLVKLF